MTPKVEINWYDGYTNDPEVLLRVDAQPSFEGCAWHKRPCADEMLDDVQLRVVGVPRKHEPAPGWHCYLRWSQCGNFATFFTWGGKPDGGFGGWTRTIRLVDGSEQRIVGGWATGAAVARSAGYGDLVEVCTVVGEHDRRGMFVPPMWLRELLAEQHPDTELVLEDRTWVVRWRHRMTKREWVEAEQRRRQTWIGELEAVTGRCWHDDLWQEFRDHPEAQPRPYSELRP